VKRKPLTFARIDVYNKNWEQQNRGMKIGDRLFINDYMKNVKVNENSAQQVF